MGFAAGMNAGSAAVTRGLTVAQEAEKEKRAQEEHKQRMEEGGLRITEARRNAQKNQQIDAAQDDLNTYIQGGVQLGASGTPEDGDYTSAGHEASRVEAYNATSPDGQAGLMRRQMGIASLKGDMGAVSQLQERQAALALQQEIGRGIQEWYAMPQEMKNQMLASGINGNVNMPGNKYLAVQTSPTPGPDGRAGYPVLTIDPTTGAGRQQFIREDQAAQIFSAMKMMQNPMTAQGALQIIGAVNKDIAAALHAHNQEQLEYFKAQDSAAFHRGQNEIGRSNAESNRIQANAAATNAQANSTRASRENQTAGQKMEEQVNALVKQYEQAYPGKTPAEYRQLALQAVTKDPDRKETPDAGLPEAGIVRIQGKYYRQGKGNKLEPVQLPGQSGSAVQALKDMAAQGQDPFAAKPTKDKASAGEKTPSAGIRVKPPITADTSSRDPNYPGGRLQFNLPFDPAQNVPNVNPDVYKRNRPY